MDLRTISLCSGYGGLDLGVGLAVHGARTVCYVERESYSAALLVARMEDATLDRAPIWDDITTFDGRAWRGAVDLVAAGFPCQEVSTAGKRAAQDGARWLWCDVARIIGEARPSLVFLENVPGILSAGVDDPATGLVQRALGDVLGDLAALGYDAEWGVLGADDVGAPHRRKRWWCLAYAHEQGLPQPRSRGQRESGAQAGGGLHGGLEQQGGELADADGTGPQGHGAEHELPARSGQVPSCGSRDDLWPPGPNGDWSDIPEDLWPATQPAVRGDAYGSAPRVDRLRALGNGVVPQVAAAAFVALAARAGIDL